jgi:hypothetical protein
MASANGGHRRRTQPGDDTNGDGGPGRFDFQTGTWVTLRSLYDPKVTHVADLPTWRAARNRPRPSVMPFG